MTSPPCINVLELLHGGRGPVRMQSTRVEDSSISFFMMLIMMFLDYFSLVIIFLLMIKGASVVGKIY